MRACAVENERLLDVSALVPPEPLERVLQAIQLLQPGEYLRVRHRREPFPLYPLLEEGGYDYRTQPGRDVAFEIFIWQRDDEAARLAVERRCARLP